MDTQDIEKINQLALTLKQNGLAASMSEAVEKATAIIVGTTKEPASKIEKELEEIEHELETITGGHIDAEAQQDAGATDTVPSEPLEEEEHGIPERLEDEGQGISEPSEDEEYSIPGSTEEEDSDISAGDYEHESSEEAADPPKEVQQGLEEYDLAKDPRPLKELMKERPDEVDEKEIMKEKPEDTAE